MSFEDNGILITGPARSGLSETAALIDGAGAFGGDVQRYISRYHATYLNSSILYQIARPLMLELGVDKKGQEPLPDIEICHGRASELGHGIAEKIETILTDQRYRDGPWYCHGAKICLVWPIWHAAFPKAKIIFVSRELDAHLKALRKTSYMQRCDTATGVLRKRTDEFWLKWIAEHDHRRNEMRECETLDMKVVWPDKAIAGDYSELQEMIKWLGLKWNEKKARKLWKD